MRREKLTQTLSKQQKPFLAILCCRPQHERNTHWNHLHLPAQPRAQEHTGWNPFVHASAIVKHDLSYSADSEGSSNGEMLGMQARQESFYLIKCSHLFPLSPYSWIHWLLMFQQLLLLSQPCDRHRQCSSPCCLLLLHCSRCTALVKHRHHTHEEPGPMHALGLPELLQHVWGTCCWSRKKPKTGVTPMLPSELVADLPLGSERGSGVSICFCLQGWFTALISKIALQTSCL